MYFFPLHKVQTQVLNSRFYIETIRMLPGADDKGLDHSFLRRVVLVCRSHLWCLKLQLLLTRQPETEELQQGWCSSEWDLFSWPNEVAVSPSNPTPNVLRHRTVSPHYVRSDMQSNSRSHCCMAVSDRSSNYETVCVTLYLIHCKKRCSSSCGISKDPTRRVAVFGLGVSFRIKVWIELRVRVGHVVIMVRHKWSY